MKGKTLRMNSSILRKTTYFMLSLLIFSCLIPFAAGFAAGSTKITVHYHPEPTSNLNWNLWIWGDGMDGKAYEFTGSDDFGKVAEYSFDKSFKELGVIVRTEDWVKDTDGDRFIPIKDGVGEVWMIGGDAKLYTEKPEIAAPPAKAGKPGEAVVSIHYFRPDGNYQDWYLAVKSSSQEFQYVPFAAKDEHGAVAEITLSNVLGEANVIYEIIHVSNPADIDKKPRTQVKYEKDGLTFYNSEWTKTFNVIERFHVQGDTKAYLTANDVPTKARFINAYLTEPNTIFITGNGGTSGGTDPTAMAVFANGAEVAMQSVTASSMDNTANWTITLAANADLTSPLFVVSPTFGTVQVQPHKLWESKTIQSLFNPQNTPLGFTFKDGAATINTWAPLASAVSIEILDDQAQPFGTLQMMAPVGQGVWSAPLDALNVGKYYRFVGTIQGKQVTWLDPYAKQLNITGDRAYLAEPSQKPTINAFTGDTTNAPIVPLKVSHNSLFSFDVNQFSNPLDPKASYEEAQKTINNAHQSGSKVYLELPLDSLLQNARASWELANPGVALDEQKWIDYEQPIIQTWLTNAMNEWIGTWKLDGVIIHEWSQLDPTFQKFLLDAVQKNSSFGLIIDSLPTVSSTPVVDVGVDLTETTEDTGMSGFGKFVLFLFIAGIIYGIVYATLRVFGKEPPDSH